MLVTKNYQEKYWHLMGEIKTQSIYFSKFLGRLEKINKTIEMILAIISTGSLGGLIIYRQFAVIWIFIIVFAQILSAIKPYFQYPKWIKICYAMIINLNNLFLYTNHYWFQVSEGFLTEKEIHKFIIKIAKRRHNFQSQYFIDTIIPIKKRIEKYANNEALKYFTSHYFKEN